MSARSRKPTSKGSLCSGWPSRAVFLTIAMLSSSSRASSAVSTGVLPFFTTYLGPRTAWAGFTSMTWPITSQSNSMRSAARCCLHRGGRELALKLLDECGHVEGLNGGKFPDAAPLAPCCEAARGIHIRLARVVVVDLGGEKFEHALGGFRRRREERGRNKHSGGGDELVGHDVGHASKRVSRSRAVRRTICRRKTLSV